VKRPEHGRRVPVQQQASAQLVSVGRSNSAASRCRWYLCSTIGLFLACSWPTRSGGLLQVCDSFLLVRIAATMGLCTIRLLALTHYFRVLCSVLQRVIRLESVQPERSALGLCADEGS
jgi:hypothetical protein